MNESMDQITSNVRTSFSNLIEQHLASNHGNLIDYDLAYPKALFLHYLGRSMTAKKSAI